MYMSSILSDELVLLRRLERADIDGNYGGWFDDPEVSRNNRHGRFPMSRRALEEYVANSEVDKSLLVLAVVVRETGTHIGNISLQNIDWIDRRAEIAFLLGEKQWQGKGVMFRAGGLLMEHAFRALNLQRVYCGTFDTNTSMKKLAVKLGMHEEGRFLKHVYKNGEYVDLLWYGVCRGE